MLLVKSYKQASRPLHLPHISNIIICYYLASDINIRPNNKIDRISIFTNKKSYMCYFDLQSAPACDSMSLNLGKWFALPSAPYCVSFGDN